MNKGLKAHLYATGLFLVMMSILLLKSGVYVSDLVVYVLMSAFFIVHAGVAMICYLEDWY
jgi:hypothetical protein